MVAKRFEDLIIWQKARAFARLVYSLTRGSAFAKDFGLKDQIRRAAVSVRSNIAEGFERNGNVEFKNFLFIAKGSCGEVRSQLHTAWDVGYLNQDEFDEAVASSVGLSRMISTFITSLKSSPYKGSKTLNL